MQNAVVLGRWTALLVLAALLNVSGRSADSLHAGFSRPAADARPWVYWFWINGNVSRDAITADLEAMQRVGIGGVLIMEVDQGTPKGEAPFGSTKWRELFSFAVTEAERLGLAINMHNTAGWAGSGGPWIKPEQSMQKLVWSETTVDGGRPFDANLPSPEVIEGFYRDVAVLAFPTPVVDEYRIENFRFKAVFETKSTPYDTRYGIPALPVRVDRLPEGIAIPRDRIVDLTNRFEAGRLRWDSPVGR